MQTKTCIQNGFGVYNAQTPNESNLKNANDAKILRRWTMTSDRLSRNVAYEY